MTRIDVSLFKLPGRINEMTSHTAIAVSHDPESNVTVEQLLERQVELSQGEDPNFTNWVDGGGFASWTKTIRTP